MKNRFRTYGKKNQGYSLLELVLIIAIVGIIAGIVARFFVQGFNIYDFVDERKTIVRESRLAIHFMNRDFRQVRGNNGVDIAAANQFKYWDYNNNEIMYQFSNGEIKRKGYALSENVKSFQFRYLKADGGYLTVPVTSDSLIFIWNVESEFTVEDGDHSKRFVVRVYPRNY